MQNIKKHSTLFIILGIIAVVVAAMLYVLLQPQQASTPSDNANTGNDTQQTDGETEPADNGTTTAPSTAAGRYVEYSDEAMQEAEGRRLIFFHAPWCPQCRDLEASIEAGTIPDGVTILKTDYDTSTELRQKYGVTIQTTLVEVDESGNEIKKFVAYDDPSLDAVMAAFDL